MEYKILIRYPLLPESLFPGSGLYRRYNPQEADAEITNNDLKTKPFYKPFIYGDLYDPALGSATAGVTSNRYKLLATGIPATSYAIAANSLDDLEDEGRNFNMPVALKSAGGQSSWPAQPCRRHQAVKSHQGNAPESASPLPCQEHDSRLPERPRSTHLLLFKRFRVTRLTTCTESDKTKHRGAATDTWDVVVVLFC